MHYPLEGLCGLAPRPLGEVLGCSLAKNAHFVPVLVGPFEFIDGVVQVRLRPARDRNVVFIIDRGFAFCAEISALAALTMSAWPVVFTASTGLPQAMYSIRARLVPPSQRFGKRPTSVLW